MIAIFGAPPGAASIVDLLSQSEKIDRIFDSYNGEGRPGAAVLVLKNHRVIHARGYGQAKLELPGSSVTEGTSFRLASLTKQFIGLAMAMLEESGSVNLNQSLRSILQEFPKYGSNITLRHLIHHQSGLIDYEDLIPSSQVTQLTDRDVLELYRAKTRSTRFTPGSRYSYSNGGYVLLGLIIERVTGQDLGDFLREQVFFPLGMRSVMYSGVNTPITDRAFGHSLRGGRWDQTDQSLTSATRGDGGIYASIEDLAIWSAALEVESPTRLVSDETLKKIFTPASLNNGVATRYGYGWVIDRYKGLKRYAHTGSSIGFRTAIQIFPEQRLTIVILTNRNGGEPWQLAEEIVDLLETP